MRAALVFSQRKIRRIALRPSPPVATTSVDHVQKLTCRLARDLDLVRDLRRLLYWERDYLRPVVEAVFHLRARQRA